MRRVPRLLVENPIGRNAVIGESLLLPPADGSAVRMRGMAASILLDNTFNGTKWKQKYLIVRTMQ